MALDPVRGSEQSKTRPCVVVQRDVVNAAIPTTLVVPFTDATRQVLSIIRPRFAAGAGGLRKASVALCNQVRAVDRMRMRVRLGRLEGDAMAAIDRGLIETFDLGSSISSG